MEEGDCKNIIIDRMIESKIFNKEEIDMLKSNIILYEKCYLLGVLDAQ